MNQKIIALWLNEPRVVLDRIDTLPERMATILDADLAMLRAATDAHLLGETE